MMEARVVYSEIFDYRSGRYEKVTDLLCPEHGSTRVSGHLHRHEIIAMAESARKQMNKPRLELV